MGDENGSMGGFQLWANLPASHKMMSPRYRDVQSSQIPEVITGDGIKIRIICGEVQGTVGPVQDIITNPEYLDVGIPAGKIWTHPKSSGYTALAYCFEGSGWFDHQKTALVDGESLVHFSDGNTITVTAGENALRFLLISGKPIREPVAWYGPIVMNTRQELEIAFDEYSKGTFIKHPDLERK